jgi:cobalt-zinc-cadmium efflux system membrane fusion protein
MKSLITLTLMMVPFSGCGPSNANEEHSTHAATGATADTHQDEGDHGDEEEHEEGHVELTAEQVEAAEIRTAAAEAGRIDTVLTLSASVSANLDAQAHISPRVGGLVRKIHASLGQSISTGDPLCEIDSVDLGRAASAFLAAAATVETSKDTLARERELLTRNLDLAREIFERERDLAEREITTLSAQYAAEQALQDAQLRLDSRVLEIEARLARERVEQLAAQRELEILGVEPADLVKMAASGDEPHAPFGAYTIRAPRDGIIVARDVTENEFVSPEMILFNLQDLSRVWVLASVYEQDLASASLGATATVHLDAFPEIEFRGEIDFIDYQIERATRATSIRIELDNGPIESWDEQWPIRPGMFGLVEISTGVHEATVVIPESALVHEDAGEFVFVTHEPGVFELRAVLVGTQGHDNVEIVEGLKPGEIIVVSGTFALKSAARAGELGEGHSH